jgi:hypothetical protein
MDVFFLSVQDSITFSNERNHTWRRIMKYAARMFAIVMLTTPLLASAQIGSQTLAAKVPFQFHVGNKAIPAGECIVRRASLDGRTLIIGNRGARVALFSSTSMVQVKQASSTNAWVFHRYRNLYFLTGIRLQGSTTVYQLPESKTEAELRAQNVPASEEILLALLQ